MSGRIAATLALPFRVASTTSERTVSCAASPTNARVAWSTFTLPSPDAMPTALPAPVRMTAVPFSVDVARSVISAAGPSTVVAAVRAEVEPPM